MYDSALLALLYGQVSTKTSSSFEVSDALFNSIILSDGSTVLNAINNATGGLTVDLGIGEGTATVSDNIYGSHTITFSNSAMDPIVGRPSLFGDSFTQSGASVANIEPTFMGDGMNVIMSDGVVFTGMTDIFSNMTFTTNSMMNISSLPTPTYLNDFSSVNSVADSASALDVYDAATAVDGLDILDLL
jgi:hypothetical protein